LLWEKQTFQGQCENKAEAGRDNTEAKKRVDRQGTCTNEKKKSTASKEEGGENKAPQQNGDLAH